MRQKRGPKPDYIPWQRRRQGRLFRCLLIRLELLTAITTRRVREAPQDHPALSTCDGEVFSIEDGLSGVGRAILVLRRPETCPGNVPQEWGMKIRHPWLVCATAWIGAILVKLLLASLRRRVASADLQQHPTDPAQGRFIYVFWHESLLAPASRPGKVNVLISLHSDGEIITRICRFLGFNVVRGSTSRRGGAALLELLQRSRDAHLAITPDGPRGPRRQMQMGAIYLASRTGLPIVPIGIGFSRAWRAKSWDRFAIPRPFSRIHGVTGTPISVPADLDREGLEEYRRLVESRLAEVTRMAEAWAEAPDAPPLLEAV